MIEGPMFAVQRRLRPVEHRARWMAWGLAL
jgi:hypothetical protein